MTVSTQREGSGYVQRATSSSPKPSGLADVIELILDRGLVIDVFVRVSLIGIEIVTIDARIVVASVDTFLRFAEATNRLDLYAKDKGAKDLPEMVESVVESASKGKSSGAIEGAVEKVDEWMSKGRERREREPEPEPRRRPRPRTREREREK